MIHLFQTKLITEIVTSMLVGRTHDLYYFSVPSALWSLRMVSSLGSYFAVTSSSSPQHSYKIPGSQMARSRFWSERTCSPLSLLSVIL